MRNFFKTGSYFFFFCVAIVAGLFPEKKGACVLLYHSVEDGTWKYGVDVRTFRRQMAYLVARYTIVRLADVVVFLTGGCDLPDKAVALTFDDGYADAYTNVFPVVKALRIPITIFLTTNLGKTLGQPDRLTWRQITEMHASGLVRFEAHGHNHLNLITALADSPKRAAEEINVCQERIKEQLGYTPRYLAYAAGHRNDTVMTFVQDAGFEAAFAITEGLVHKGDALFAVKRIQVDRTMSFLLFKLRLTRAVDVHRRCIDFIRTCVSPWYGTQQ